MKLIDTATLILSEKAVRASQFYDNVDVSRLILDTITELERRKLEENSRLYYPPSVTFVSFNKLKRFSDIKLSMLSTLNT